jgi:hypothetical protein
MSDCPVLSACPFFAGKLKNMPKTADLLKDRYCRSRHAVCARWVIREGAGPDKVPEDLFPHQADRANKMLRELGLEGLDSDFPK